MKCPCCGEAMRKQTTILVDLNSNRLAVGWRDEEIQLLPREAEVLHVLETSMPRFVSGDEIRESVWGRYGAHDYNPSNLRIQIKKLRRKINPMDLEIVSHHASSLGYKLQRANSSNVPRDSGSDTHSREAA